MWVRRHHADARAASAEPTDMIQTSEGRKLMSTDAIVLLKTDHKDIREQFRRFQQAGENAAAAKGRIVEKIIELLTVHTYIENEVMYPEVRRLLPDLEDDVPDSYPRPGAGIAVTRSTSITPIRLSKLFHATKPALADAGETAADRSCRQVVTAQ